MAAQAGRKTQNPRQRQGSFICGFPFYKAQRLARFAACIPLYAQHSIGTDVVKGAQAHQMADGQLVGALFCCFPCGTSISASLFFNVPTGAGCSCSHLFHHHMAAAGAAGFFYTAKNSGKSVLLLPLFF